MSNYSNAFTEVYTILNTLEDEDYEKIPSEVLKAIEQNRNLDYEYELDEELELREQPMMKETKAILFNLFRDYLSTYEQKEKIIRMQQEERKRNELEKQQKYRTDIFKNNENKVSNIKTENTEIIEYKEGILQKVINKIKSFFNKKLI